VGRPLPEKRRLSCRLFYHRVRHASTLSKRLLRNEMLSEIARTGRHRDHARRARAVRLERREVGADDHHPPTPDTSGTPIVDAVKPYLIGFDLSQTQSERGMAGRGQFVQQKVRVTITSNYKPILTFPLG